jgi:hypothetical protein
MYTLFFTASLMITFNTFASVPFDAQTKSTNENVKTKDQNKSTQAIAHLAGATATAAAQPKQDASAAAPQVPNAPTDNEWPYDRLLKKAKDLENENLGLRMALLRQEERLEKIDKQRQHYLVWASRALEIIWDEKKAPLLKGVYSAAMDSEDIPNWTNGMLYDQLEKLWKERQKNGDARYRYPADYCEEDNNDQDE